MGDNFSAIFSGVACLISVYAVLASRRTDKAKNTLDIWAMWISKDYREYRVTSQRAIEELRKQSAELQPMNYDDLIKDQKVQEAVGSVEHFVDEASKLMIEGLLDKKLFNALFSRSMADWRGLLGGFAREPHKSFSNDEIRGAFKALIGDQSNQPGRFDWPLER